MTTDAGDPDTDLDDLDDLEEIDELDAEAPEIDEGRYLYCIVQADEDATFETDGVDGEPVSIVTTDGIGAVVHACDEIYDSADLTQVKRWLVRHQTVVDEAGDAFGTPIPFQFDTILRGDDDGVREWLREESEMLDRALTELAGHWEYRVEVVETEPIGDEDLIERDDRLRELDEQISGSEEGTAFLLEKQYEQRVKELQRARRESITDDLQERLADVTREVHTLERSPSAAVGEVADSETTDGGETLCRLTLLAHEDDEEAVGSLLDDVAAAPGLEVRFSGPWPPYTFAPELGGNGDT
ncbi:gas vesicle protein GvpFL [Natronococcus pandeyae]|uniref:Gas vesicle protein GvpFL n=1 Tax=Natronococcus pandeyae TaxID=2055836 RepID=A0A8J8TPW6_9EURY|nr:GvpL/GvpF family gas vesicle protein [Natronococcus pandeyae]TYL36280.1 gas vesicle protein GvpFL [Natronococcus pandeyae]